MTRDDGILEDLKESLRPLGSITSRRMFSGAGLYCDGQIFALILNGDLYLKTVEPDRAAFAAEGCGPFTYDTKNGTKTITSYYRAPDRLLDDPGALQDWSRRAVAAGRQAEAAKPAKARQRAKTVRASKKARNPS